MLDAGAARRVLDDRRRRACSASPLRPGRWRAPGTGWAVPMTRSGRMWRYSAVPVVNSYNGSVRAGGGGRVGRRCRGGGRSHGWRAPRGRSAAVRVRCARRAGRHGGLQRQAVDRRACTSARSTQVEMRALAARSAGAGARATACGPGGTSAMASMGTGWSAATPQPARRRAGEPARRARSPPTTGTARVYEWRHAPWLYGAVHFPRRRRGRRRLGYDVCVGDPSPICASGVYALRLRAGGFEDHAPFFVRASRRTGGGRRAGAADGELYGLRATSTWRPAAPDGPGDHRATRLRCTRSICCSMEHPELGLSTYEPALRRQRSVARASRRRPIVNMRPRHRFSFMGTWQFPSDLYIVDWLEHLGYRIRRAHRRGSAP